MVGDGVVPHPQMTFATSPRDCAVYVAFEAGDELIRFYAKPIVAAQDFRSLNSVAKRSEPSYLQIKIAAADRVEAPSFAFTSDEDYVAAISHFEMGTLLSDIITIPAKQKVITFYGELVPPGVYLHARLTPAADPRTTWEKLVPMESIVGDYDGVGVFLMEQIPTEPPPDLQSAIQALSLSLSFESGTDMQPVIAWNFAEDSTKFNERRYVVNSLVQQNPDLDVPFRAISFEQLAQEVADAQGLAAAWEAFSKSFAEAKNEEAETRIWVGLRTPSKETRERAAALPGNRSREKAELLRNTTVYVVEVSTQEFITRVLFVFA